MAHTLLVILLVTYLSTVVASDQMQITPEELHYGINNNHFDLIIDTRRQSEWDEGHIPNATFIEDLQTYLSSDLPEIIGGPCKESCRHIVVYCRSGGRSSTAVDLLSGAGYKNVYNGLGVKQWKAAGFELVNTTSRDPLCSRKDENSTCLNVTDDLRVYAKSYANWRSHSLAITGLILFINIKNLL